MCASPGAHILYGQWYGNKSIEFLRGIPADGRDLEQPHYGVSSYPDFGRYYDKFNDINDNDAT